jgi:SH3-like domain-containing protein
MSMMNGVPTRFALALAVAVSTACVSGPLSAQDVAAVGPVTSLPLPRYVSIRAREANARRGPSLTHRVDWEYRRRGLPVEVTGEYGQWRRVRDADGAGGWVHHSLLSGTRTGLVLGDQPVRLQAGASDRTALRAMLEPGVVARIESCDATWCDVSVDGLEGWVPQSALWGVDPGEILD